MKVASARCLFIQGVFLCTLIRNSERGDEDRERGEGVGGRGGDEEGCFRRQTEALSSIDGRHLYSCNHGKEELEEGKRSARREQEEEEGRRSVKRM